MKKLLIFFVIFLVGLPSAYGGVGNRKKREEHQRERAEHRQQEEKEKQLKEPGTQEEAAAEETVPEPAQPTAPTFIPSVEEVKAKLKEELRKELEMQFKKELVEKERLQKLALEKLRLEKEEKVVEKEEERRKIELERNRLKNQKKELQRQMEEERKKETAIRQEIMAKIKEEQRQKERLREQIIAEEKLKEQIRRELREEMEHEKALKEKLREEIRLEELKKKDMHEQELAHKTPGAAKALTIAKAISHYMRSLRLKYVELVVAKLEKEGFGSALNVENLKGYVPLPADYIHQVASFFKQQVHEKDSFALAQRSLWNLRFDNHLKDDFERKGWAFMEGQQQDQLQAKKPLKDILWRPFIRVQESEGLKVLRYFDAEPATLPACVACHNKWERLDEVKSLRGIHNVEPEKEFQLHELMGALSITVPIEAPQGTSQEEPPI